MLRYLSWRIGLAVPTVLGVVTVVFLLIHLIPGDPVDAMLGESALAVDKEAVRHRLGLHRPVAVQYGLYLRRLARGSLGRSLAGGRPVRRMIVARFPATIELTAAGLLVAIAIAFPLGLAAAARPRSVLDVGCISVALIGAAVPNFWLGPMLMLCFAVWLGWLPVSGRNGLPHLILPAVTLGLGMASVLARLLRASLLDQLHGDHLRAARAKGASEVRVLLRHALPNALLPVVTVMGLQAGALLSGAILTETIFGWPGLGRLTVTAIETRDYPLVQGCVLVIALTYVAVNLAADLLCLWVDPRIRASAGGE
ncbi:MAG TPA: ABC transporter permease [Candidatus Binatia bacterium]|nr:ABC transporter permease [Candidatus Binatia bacterium]